MNFETRQYGGLTCEVVDSLPRNTSPGLLVMLCHGFGAPGDDLVDFGPMVLEADEQIASQVRFVFPAAPIDLGPMGMPGGRAWWPINMAKLAEINQTQDFSQLTNMEPPGMKDAGEKLSQCIDAALTDAGLTSSQLVLGGFSQGAMVSTQVVLTSGLVPRLLVLFSGSLLNREEWEQLAASHPKCPVLQSHGRQDPILPYAAAVQLRDLLSAQKFPVEFLEFQGPHTIPIPVLQRFAERLLENESPVGG